VVWPQNHSDGFHRFDLKNSGDGFSSVWGSKPMATVFKWISLKTTQTVFVGLTSKPVVTVSISLTSKPAATISTGLTSKPVVGFLVEHQNQSGGGFFGLGLKIGRSGLMI
jgi:hypothetical protein